MQVNSINYNTPNFQARIKIQKGIIIDKLLKTTESVGDPATSSIMTTGSGLSATGIASGLEQSIHYPNSLFAREVYDSVINSSGGDNGLIAKSILTLEKNMHEGPTAGKLIGPAPDSTGSCAFCTSVPAGSQSMHMAYDIGKDFKAVNKEKNKRIPS